LIIKEKYIIIEYEKQKTMDKGSVTAQIVRLK